MGNCNTFGKSDEILANHASAVTIFDVLPPMKYEGTDAYRKSWKEWQPATDGPGLFEIHDLKITSGHDVAFAHCFIQCGGTRPDGETFEDWVRATFAFATWKASGWSPINISRCP